MVDDAIAEELILADAKDLKYIEAEAIIEEKEIRIISSSIQNV